MIYIDPTTHGFFKSLSLYLHYQIKQETEITDDYTKKGLWILNYYSCIYSNAVEIITANGCEYIAIQTEPLHYKQNKIKYFEFLKNAKEVWDYMKGFDIGYSLSWILEKEEAKDIDFLFFGSVNKRRQDMFDKIGNVTVLDKVFYPELYKYINRSKIILSVNYYEDSNADWARIAPLLSTNNFVISEKCNSDEFNKLNDYLVIRDYDDIPSTCQYYLSNPIERIIMADKGFNYIKYERNTTFQSLHE